MGPLRSQAGRHSGSPQNLQIHTFPHSDRVENHRDLQHRCERLRQQAAGTHHRTRDKESPQLLPGQMVRWQTVWCLLYTLLYLDTVKYVDGTEIHLSFRSVYFDQQSAPVTNCGYIHIYPPPFHPDGEELKSNKGRKAVTVTQMDEEFLQLAKRLHCTVKFIWTKAILFYTVLFNPDGAHQCWDLATNPQSCGSLSTNN